MQKNLTAVIVESIDRCGGDTVSGILDILASIYNDDPHVFEEALHALRLSNLDTWENPESN